MTKDSKSIQDNWLKLQTDASSAKNYLYRFQDYIDDEGEEIIRWVLWNAWPAAICYLLYKLHDVHLYLKLVAVILLAIPLSVKYWKFKRRFSEVWSKKENKTLENSSGNNGVQNSTGRNAAEEKKVLEKSDESNKIEDSDAASEGEVSRECKAYSNKLENLIIPLLDPRWKCELCTELATSLIPPITYLDELAIAKTRRKRKHLRSLILSSLESVLTVLDKIEPDLKLLEKVKRYEKFVLSLKSDFLIRNVQIRQYVEQIKARGEEGLVTYRMNEEKFYKSSKKLRKDIRKAIKEIQSLEKKWTKADKKDEFDQEFENSTKELLIEEIDLMNSYIELLQTEYDQWETAELVKQAKNFTEMLTTMVKKPTVDKNNPGLVHYLYSMDSFLVKSALKFHQKLAVKEIERQKTNREFKKEFPDMKADSEECPTPGKNLIHESHKYHRELWLLLWQYDRLEDILWLKAHCGFACRISMSRHVFLAKDLVNKNQLTYVSRERDDEIYIQLSHWLVWLYTKYEECKTKIKDYIEHRRLKSKNGTKALQIEAKYPCTKDSSSVERTSSHLSMRKSLSDMDKEFVEQGKEISDVSKESKTNNSPVTESTVSEAKDTQAPAKDPLDQTSDPRASTKYPLIQAKDSQAPAKDPLDQTSDPRASSKYPLIQAKDSQAPAKDPLDQTSDPRASTKYPLIQAKDSQAPANYPLAQAEIGDSLAEGKDSQVLSKYSMAQRKRSKPEKRRSHTQKLTKLRILEKLESTSRGPQAFIPSDSIYQDSNIQTTEDIPSTAERDTSMMNECFENEVTLTDSLAPAKYHLAEAKDSQTPEIYPLDQVQDPQASTKYLLTQDKDSLAPAKYHLAEAKDSQTQEIYPLDQVQDPQAPKKYPLVQTKITEAPAKYPLARAKDSMAEIGDSLAQEKYAQVLAKHSRAQRNMHRAEMKQLRARKRADFIELQALRARNKLGLPREPQPSDTIRFFRPTTEDIPSTAERVTSMMNECFENGVNFTDSLATANYHLAEAKDSQTQEIYPLDQVQDPQASAKYLLTQDKDSLAPAKYHLAEAKDSQTQGIYPLDQVQDPQASAKYLLTQDKDSLAPAKYHLAEAKDSETQEIYPLDHAKDSMAEIGDTLAQEKYAQVLAKHSRAQRNRHRAEMKELLARKRAHLIELQALRARNKLGLPREPQPSDTIRFFRPTKEDAHGESDSSMGESDISILSEYSGSETEDKILADSYPETNNESFFKETEDKISADSYPETNNQSFFKETEDELLADSYPETNNEPFFNVTEDQILADSYPETNNESFFNVTEYQILADSYPETNNESFFNVTEDELLVDSYPETNNEPFFNVTEDELLVDSNPETNNESFFNVTEDQLLADSYPETYNKSFFKGAIIDPETKAQRQKSLRLYKSFEKEFMEIDGQNIIKDFDLM